MAHETSIGSDQRIFEVHLQTVPKTIWELMDATQQAEVNGYDVLDGYLYVESSNYYISHKIGGVEETFAPMKYSYFPFLDWHKKALIRSETSTPSRVKLILGFIKRN